MGWLVDIVAYDKKLSLLHVYIEVGISWILLMFILIWACVGVVSEVTCAKYYLFNGIEN